MKNIILTIIGSLFAIDFIGFLLWSISGQVPPDNYYIGTLSHHIIQFVINLI